MRSTIICVDDDKWVLSVLADLLTEWLGANYTIEKALSGPEALDIISECLGEGTEVSLVVSDYIMPGMKGDELLEHVKNKTPTTRRIMLTGYAAIDGITNAINKAGIYRFISKPWDNKDMMLTVLQAIRSYEQDKRAENLAASHKELYHKFQNLYISLQANMKQYVYSLAAAAELRGGVPGHARRVAELSLLVAAEMKMTDDDKKLLEVSALLHGVGRLGLTDEEAAAPGTDCYMNKELAVKQAKFAKTLMAGLDAKLLPGVLYHTERADGGGPYGLELNSIPVAARIICLCSFYDTMSAMRKSDTPSAVLMDMSLNRDKIFDPALFDLLIRVTARGGAAPKQ